MARIGRPIFRRHETYVAVKPIKLTANDTIKKGEVVDLPIHRLRSLYQRRRIGPKGHPWTKAMLKADFFPKLTVKAEAGSAPFVDRFPVRIGEIEDITVEAFTEWVGQAMGAMDIDREVGDLCETAMHAILDHMIANKPPQSLDWPALLEMEDDSAPADIPEAGTEPTKTGKKWGFEGVEETWKTKKAATEWLAAQHAE